MASDPNSDVEVEVREVTARIAPWVMSHEARLRFLAFVFLRIS